MRLGQRRLPDSITLPRAWRRALPALCVLLAGATVAVLDRTHRQAAPTVVAQSDDLARFHDHFFHIVHVVDGDTVDIDAPEAGKARTRIRLWGVDTPEIAHNKGEHDMYFGPEARDFAAQTLNNREVQIVLWSSRTRDRYGRLLAYIFLERGGRMFNEMLLEEGLAYADTRFAHPYKQEFEKIETRSHKQSKGLWAAVRVEQMPNWRQRREKPLATSISGD